MADSEDEDALASFGTPFELLEEDAPRKKAIPIYEQIVTDTEGRRRFHGAFTGGFSAGYFNTVSTKEGWQPSTFVSSRSNKMEQRAQRPEDFMDDEDMGEFGIAPKRITTKEKFSVLDREPQSRKRVVASEDALGVIPGEPVLQDLILPVKMSVGVELLKKMGWKEGQGVGPRERRTKKKVYGCSLPPGLSSEATDHNQEEEDIFAVGLLFAPKDVDAFTFTPKDNKHGLGYKGLNPSTALIGREDWLGINPVSSRVGKKGIIGEAFGVGAFEEDDDDIYAVDHMSNYDPELTAERSSGLHGWTGPPKENTKGGALSIFTSTSKVMDAMKTFPPPVVPRDFNCTHTFSSAIKEVNNQTGKALTASDRGEMLGEEPIPSPKKSVFEYMSKEDKERILLSSKDVVSKPSKSPSTAVSSASSASINWSSTISSGHSSFKPFAKDSAKQARYEEFLKMQRGEQVSQKLTDSGLTEWEREREQEEFSRSAALYRPLNTTMAARFTTAEYQDDHRTVYKNVPAQEPSDLSDQIKAASMKMFGKLTRDNLEWHPNKILCKRFNIPNPYPGSDVVGVPQVRRPKFTLGQFLTPDKPHSITYDPSTSSGEGSQSGKLEKTSETARIYKALLKPSEPMSVTSELTVETSVGSSSTAKSFSSETNVGVIDVARGTEEEKTSKESKYNEGISARKRPPMDLFKAIFADSSSDESEASEGDEDDNTERLATQVSEDQTVNEKVVNNKSEVSRVSDPVIPDQKVLEEGLSTVKGNEEEFKTTEAEPTTVKLLETEKRETSPDIFGPAPPPSLRYTEFSRPFCREKHTKDRAHSKEDLESERRIKKDRRKDLRKRNSESSDSEEEYKSKHKHKHKEKKKHKHKRKSKSRHRDEEREKHKQGNIKDTQTVESSQTGNISLSDDKQILSKLKNLQSIKAGKRMRAIDFM